MLPILEGIIARRVLLNFRADPQIVQAMLPKPFLVDLHRGASMVGICLIRLEGLRPRGLPSRIGISSENVAHRVAVCYPHDGEIKTGVFIWRRETDQKLVQMLGGRLFPGVHHGARFNAEEHEDRIKMEVKSGNGGADVRFSAQDSPWRPTPAFNSLQEASAFFKRDGCGFSCNLRGDQIEGMELKIAKWSPRAITVELEEAEFYENSKVFPKGSIEFDCGLIMRQVPHEWHGIRNLAAIERVSVPSFT